VMTLNFEAGETAPTCLIADLETPLCGRVRMDTLQNPSQLILGHQCHTHTKHIHAGITLVKLLSTRY
jgi:hypothetical protein